MRMITGFCVCACALALCLCSGLFSSSTMVVLSRTLADSKTRHSSDEDAETIDDQRRKKNQERSLIIGAVSSVHHSHSNRTRRHEYEEEDDEEEDEEEDRYEDRFVFVGANYRFADKRGNDDDDDDEEDDVGRREIPERRADDNNEGIRRTGGGGKRFEIDVEIGRSRGKAKRNGLLRPDRRLRRQENPKTVSPSTPEIPDAAGPTEEAATIDRLSPLGFLDAMQTSLPPDCLSSTASKTITLAHDLPPALHSTFAEQTSSLVQIANVLNNLFAGSYSDDLSSPDQYGVFYYSLVRAVVESNEALSAAAIAFGRRDEDEEGDRGPMDRRSGPLAYRNRTNGRVYVRDLANATQGYFSREEVSDERRLSWINRSPSLPASSSSSSSSSSLHSFHSSVATGKRVACPSEAAARSGAVDHSDQRLLSAPPTVTEIADGTWSRPYFDCAVGARAWLLTYSLPFFGCSRNSELVLKGIVKIELDLSKVDINQCPNAGGIFKKTDRCHPSTTCTFVAKHGFRRGGYRCTCQTGYYPPTSSAASAPSRHGHHHAGGGGGGSKPVSFDGWAIERSSHLLNLTAAGAGADFACLPCAEGCERCDDGAPCPGTDDFIVSVIALVLQSVTMTATLLATVVVIRLRHTKVMKASFWVLLEIIIFGALMMYATVVIQYVTPSDVTCILVPWFREIGFIIVYGSLTLKVYRVLAEFQSRKAQRILLRDKDLLKYLATMVTIVVGYMVTWTVINVDHVWKGSSMVHFENGTKYSYCNSTYWDYVIELEEFLFLLTAIYICYCIRSAPSFYLESKYISWAIYNETALSAIFNIIRHCLWSTVHPNYLYWMYFIRCQMTVTVTVLLVIGTKVWYIHRPPDDAICRRRTYSTTDGQDTGAPEATKLTPSIGYGIGGGGGGGGAGGVGGGGGEGDVGDINLSDMNPDDIRAELKRLYTQLQIYKTKSMRKDNPHISKRRGGRKPTHRRFSLQAFHYNKHKLQQGSSSAEAASCEHENEASRSPEESTNSIDVVPVTAGAAGAAAAAAAAAAVEGDAAAGGPGGDGEGRARSTSLSSRTASVHR